MVLISLKLYNCGKPEVIDFSLYFEQFTQFFFKFIGLYNTNMSLTMNMEDHFFFDMDTAKPRK